MMNILYLGIAMSILGSFLIPIQNVKADCDLPGEGHDDNSPSMKEGKQMIQQGANACEIAKACDAMEIKVKIDSDELEQAHFYQIADHELKGELKEVAEDGHGAEGIECYEMEYAVEEAS